MKVLVALDSFKGSISSKEANEAVKKACQGGNYQNLQKNLIRSILT